MALQDQLVEQLRGWITGVTLETAWSPPVVIRDPFAPGPPSPLLEALKPRLTFEIARGAAKPLVISPYGAPEPSRWPLVKVVAVVSVATLAFLAVRSLR